MTEHRPDNLEHVSSCLFCFARARARHDHDHKDHDDQIDLIDRAVPDGHPFYVAAGERCGYFIPSGQCDREVYREHLLLPPDEARHNPDYAVRICVLKHGVAGGAMAPLGTALLPTTDPAYQRRLDAWNDLMQRANDANDSSERNRFFKLAALIDPHPHTHKP